MPLSHKNTKSHKVLNTNNLNFMKSLRLGVFVANVTFRNGFKLRALNSKL
jgi:hypothetical protein